ncbi:MAG: Ig-like domain-containing protein [Chloroflexi bacterium]|uniref:Alpha-amylase family glycosyl hydrolase n=1 Tax=Candidatus Chlorohelix allophototropha TaxID=3003348 RepID=A0A8T7M000_9CHLR|nr:Ig-like domain-containing protein [Chloroflexota bacterium]WJW66490.1 alpha-amylase family glycosyl hydrolase [Chloroflexota bacterium L227-S17]
MRTNQKRRASHTLVMLCMLLSSVLTTFSGAISFVQAANTPNPTSVTIAGSLQTAIGCPGNWDPTCASAHLDYNTNNDVWAKSWAVPTGNYEYKAALNNSWNENYGLNAASGGANIPLNLTANTSVKFYYDHKTNWITDNVNSIIATVPGDFQQQLGCSGNWDPSCLRTWLEDPSGSGTYSFETKSLLKGSYQGKVAIGESWNENYGQGGLPGGANISFVVVADHAKVTFKYDPKSHILSISSGHQLDNNVEYDGLSHNSRDTLYRTPSGAVNPGTPVSLRFRTFHNDAANVTIRLYDTAIGHEDKEPMTIAASNVDCYDPALTSNGDTCDFWEYTYTPSALGTVYYRFIITDGTATAYYSDNLPRYGGLGEATPNERDNGFRLNIVDPKFKVIPWVENGVMYQIFPDRFRNGENGNDPKPTDPRYDYPAPANATPQQIQAANDAQIMLKNWSDLPEGYCRAYTNLTTPCNESAKGRDYFGGDLKGIIEKLNYLKNLGITIIYLNPIFESGSNHGYDTRDYTKISQYFGTNSDFKDLVKEADARGIQIVLDGVFNHMSSDSPFFDRYHHYSTVGACEDVNSQYRSWFVFHDVTPGTGVCVDSQNRQNSATYDGWAGFDSIPVIVKRDATNPNKPYAPVAKYFYSDSKTSIANIWLKRGAAGWRFDVMTDPSFPDSYWQQLRTITKGIDPDEIIIAEAWHWYDNLPLTHGNEADTAMGYRFRNAVLGLLGAVDNKGFDEEGNPNLPPSTFAKRMDSMREDYADATYYTFQNLLDSHDTKRLLWSLTPGNENRQDKEFNAANLALGEQRQRIAALVQMTVPGTPTIYYGDEIGLTGADDPDDRRTFPWSDLENGLVDTRCTTAASTSAKGKKDPYFGACGDHSLFDWYQNLIQVRKSNPVLRNGKLTFLLTDDTNKTLAYAMRNGNNLAIIVVNRNESATQTITVPTGSYLRDGVNLTDSIGGGSITTTAGKFSVNLAPLGAAIFLMKSGTDITGPAPSTKLTATPINGVTSSVTLSWKGNADSASYNVYRSVVHGGGYVLIGNSTVTSFTDTKVTNGTSYYYVIRGVDSLGNEGNNSNEANATPAFPIGYAVVQWPKTITQNITSNYVTVYGQVWINGLTDANLDPSLVKAQLGYGVSGSNSATWSWAPMSFNVKAGNNYEYMTGLRADKVGIYNYLVRFSDDGGRTWVYGDQNGIGTTTPGVLTLNPSSDTTAPSTPVASIDYGAASLTVSWTASTDPDSPVAEYRIYRGTSPGAEAATALAIVSGSTLSYQDNSVAAGVTYYYAVKAFDTSLNASAPSNEVSHIVTPKIVQVTFRVKVPAFTPSSDQIYITGQAGGVSPDPLCGYCGGNSSTVMTETAPGSHIWQITLGIPEGTAINYKYTRGNYNFVEEWGTIVGFTNRDGGLHVQAVSPTNLTQLVDDTSDTNPDDNHKAVQNWRDALVTGTTASTTAIGVTFNWDVKPTGTDFSNAISVTGSGGAVAGTITHDSANNKLVFTPTTPLAAGTYTVTVNNVVSLTVQNDGVSIRTPYTFTFTV